MILFFSNSNAEENNIKYYSEDTGTLSIMYHRFDENKYPSTNIQMHMFKDQMDMIIKNNLNFYNPKEFDLKFTEPKKQKKILITIDDAFNSFYKNAWPYFKKNKIPFILFVSTKPVGNSGYMTWEQIKEVEKEDFAFIGNHSHSHEYMVNFKFTEFKKDIETSINIFNEKLGYNPKFFSYPFGEYSLEQKNFIKEKFSYGFGQHSGVIDFNKDKFELPRFPINEKYGDLKRFESLIKLMPLQYKKIFPEDKLISNSDNPPKMYIEFFEKQNNLNLINCFSNESGEWKNTDLELKKNKLIVNFKKKFDFRRGRINCSMNDKKGWRWLGVQFSILEN